MSRARSISDLLRRHIHTKALEDTGALKGMLRDIIAFNETILLAEKPQFDAKLRLRAVKDGKQCGDFSTDLSMWTAVLPWETARGLSCVSSAELKEEAGAPAKGMLFADPSYSRGSVNFWSGAITAPIDVAFLRCVDPHRSLKSELESIIRSPLQSRMLDVRYELLNFGWLDPLPTGSGGNVPDETMTGQSFTVQSHAKRIEMVLETRRFLFGEAAQIVAKEAGVAESELDMEVSLNLSDALFEDLADKYRLSETVARSLGDRVSGLLRQMNCAVPDAPKSQRDARNPRRSRMSFEAGGGSDDDQIINAAETSPAFEKSMGAGAQRLRKSTASASSRFPRGDPAMPPLPTMDYELMALGWRLGLAQDEAMRHFNRMAHDLQHEALSTSDFDALAELARDPSVCLPTDVRQLILAACR